MTEPIGAGAFRVGDLYSVDELQAALGVGNAGGVRVALSADGEVRRAVVLTSDASARQLRENPYHDRIEGDVLVYTGAGREGDQSLTGVNRRIPQQAVADFPVYGFTLVGSRRDQTIGPKRWRFLGLLEYLRHYPEVQADARGQTRRVWVFELRVHSDPPIVQVAQDLAVSKNLLGAARLGARVSPDEREVVTTATIPVSPAPAFDPAMVELTRGKLLSVPPERFEHLVRDLLLRTGFDRASVTRYSQDGGIDVNAYASMAMWPVRNLLVQVQVKRWLHTVGRKEVAELRGSLAAHARGSIVTTSHFSKAALSEAAEPGKVPIVLIDGYEAATLVLRHNLPV